MRPATHVLHKIKVVYFPGQGYADCFNFKRAELLPPAGEVCFPETFANSNTCIYVGDSEPDILTAKNLGVKCLSVLWGFRDKEILVKKGAEKLVSNIKCLESIIL